MNEPHGSGAARLLITGASGQLGRRTAELVLETAAPERLILVTRSPGKLADLAARGADVRFGDFEDPASLPAAFQGAARMLLISATDLERRVRQHRDAIRAAVKAGVTRIVYTSGLAPEPGNPAAVAPSHYATEQSLAAQRIDWTILRNSLYAEYQAVEAQRAIETGQLVHNRGDGRVAYVSREDCARAAAAVLVDGGHENVIYDITGPERYGASDLAKLYSELGGRDVTATALDDEQFVAGLIGDAGEDDHLRYGAQLVASFGRAIREDHMSSCTDAVARLAGIRPRGLREVLEPLVGPG